MPRDAKKKDDSNELQKSPQSEILTMQVEASPKNRGKKYLRKTVTVQGSELGLHRDTDRRQKTPNKTMFKKSWQREDPQGAHSCQAAGIKSFQTTRKYREGHPPLGSNATVIANETIICRFCVCKCAYSLKFISHPQINTQGISWSSRMCKEQGKNESSNMHVLPAEAELGNIWHHSSALMP